MLNNYFISALRFIKRNRLYAGVNMAGLSISLTFCLLISIYLGGAFGWDRMHSEYDRTYLISLQKYLVDGASDELGIFDFNEKQVERYSSISYAHAKGITDNFPEIENHTLIFNLAGNRKTNLEAENRDIYEEIVTSAEGSFFDIFNFRIISGNPQEVLEQPQHLILSKSKAEKYFGDSDPIGEYINLVFDGESIPFKVGAVVEMPEKSSVNFGILIGFDSDKRLRESDFTSQSRAQFILFSRLTANVELTAFDSKVNMFFKKSYPDYIDNARRFSDLGAESNFLELKATSLSSIHLSRILSWHNKVDYRSILLTSLFVLVLIIISGINYLLISLAMLSKRLSSVSVRRVIGARRSNVFFQFWLENMITTSISLIISLCLAQLLTPYVQESLHGNPIWSFDKLVEYAAYLLIILAIVNFVISLYPTSVITKFKLTDSLKSGSTYKANTSFMNFLITAQFVICFGFISSGLIMNTQVEYLLNKELGFDKEEIIKISRADKLLSERLESLPEVESVGRGGAWLFGHGQMGFLENIGGKPYTLVQLESESELLDLLNLNIEWLNKDFGDAPAAIISSGLADLLGRDSLMNIEIGFNQRIVGVLEAVNLLPLTEQEELYFINPNSDERRLWETYVKFEPGQMNQGISKVNEIWSELYPKEYFKYDFLDEYVAENYQEYQSSSKLINTTTFLVIVIACLGLFALNGIVVNNRMKEFGIRKVLGATMNQIMLLVNGRILTIYLISLTIALPVSYYLMQNWSSKFRFQSDDLNQKLALTAFIGLLLMILTVSIHTIKSSRVNPTELLKDE